MPTAADQRRNPRETGKHRAPAQAANKTAGDLSRSAAEKPDPRSNGDVSWLTIRGAAGNNLRNIDVAFPLARFVCVTGVSGSGKSTLVNEILYSALARDLNGATTEVPGKHAGIDGLEHLDKIIAIDQTPIGRTPRSNPATYIKLFDEIRTLFTKLPDSKLRGYKPGRFSFNVSMSKGGGRCEACEGNGANKIEMDFLADVWVTCAVCAGRRFTSETLRVAYKGRSIADVLEMDVQQALEHFENVPRIRAMLQTLHDVGLDYIKLGQASPTLSGGEAQRIKLARELVKKPTGRTIYVLDEPTTGLHFEDVRRLLTVLHGFVDAGNSVVVIEHNLDVVKTADWVIDLGPEGGAGGGTVVCAGTPEELAAHPISETGKALREVLTPPRERAATGAEIARAAALTAKRNGEQRERIRASAERAISVRGAREHNLKDVTVEFPRNAMTVCAGVSGSGKTSFAIDTVFAEGYRRYVESLSAYARQFLGQLQKPRVEQVSGLSPAICIEQKTTSRSPRSTVGTVTEIYDYMRVLWARLGQAHCVKCGGEVGAQTVDEILAQIMALEENSPVIVLAPLKLGDGESWAGVIARLKSSGYQRVRVDGELSDVARAAALDARRKHRVEVVVDRTVIKQAARSRITESVEHALALGGGVMTLLIEAFETVEQAEAPATEARPHRDAALSDEATNAQAGVEEKTPAESTIRRRPQREMRFSQRRACAKCGISYEELGPHQFSFNSQLGWCETCEGLGVQRGAPASQLIARPDKSILGGAIAGWGIIERGSTFAKMLTALCLHLDVDVDTPLRDWPAAAQQTLLFGTPPGTWISSGKTFPGVRFGWRGFFPTIDAATRNSWELRHKLHQVVTEIPCTTCRGGRLRPDAAAAKLSGRTIVDVCDWPLEQVAEFFAKLRLDAREKRIAGELLLEIRHRLQFLLDVGLEYLHLHRAAPTLSGGEAQRIRLASQIGSGLTGVLYVLDEPTIGLHPRDNARLIAALQKLRGLGNTLLLVEHDREVIASADRVIDFGPAAGRGGGYVVANDAPAALRSAAAPAARPPAPVDGEDSMQSLTRGYLSGALAIPVPSNRRPTHWPDWPAIEAERDSTASNRRSRKALAVEPPANAATTEWLTIHGARHNNLKELTVPFPLARFICVTGVSGSGKSSLINDILWPALANKLNRASLTPGAHHSISGLKRIDKVINVDQDPIGFTPASNPATYTGAFDLIRELFARLPESKVRGYTANKFSFNRPGGRCEACEGNGQKKIEMHFMADVWVECETCRGRRYTLETLEVKFKGKSIADVLELSAREALELFSSVPKVRRLLQTLVDVGLDYVPLGQSAATLSGGEAQRVKLATELGKPDTGQTLYLLDEPTTGLHFDDIRKLLDVMQRLVDLGNTVVVVEHNLDVIKCADWLIELGPEAGAAGGHLIALGSPEELINGEAARRCHGSVSRAPGKSASAKPSKDIADPMTHTARALQPVLAESPKIERKAHDRKALAAQQLADEKAGFGSVGKEVKAPWQIDGRAWHLNGRRSRTDKPVRWEAAALEFVLETVQKSGAFAPTDWNNRASVEITAPDAPQWFLHALTGGEWLIECYFRVPPGTFQAVRLNAELGLKTLDQRDDLQTYGSFPRVDVRERQDGLDAVVVYVHDKAEIDTPAFRRFVKQAAKAYFDSFA